MKYSTFKFGGQKYGKSYIAFDAVSVASEIRKSGIFLFSEVVKLVDTMNRARAFLDLFEKISFREGVSAILNGELVGKWKKITKSVGAWTNSASYSGVLQKISKPTSSIWHKISKK